MFVFHKSQFLSIFCFCLIFQLTKAQDVSDSQIKEIMAKAEASGLSQATLEEMAAKRGASSSDIEKIKQRAAGLKGGAAPKIETTPVATKREQNGDTLTQVNVQEPNTTISNTIFGSSLFNTKSLSFEPNLRLPTPRDYVLGPDDELNIDISGYAYQHYTTKISPEGTIRIENLAPIFVNGITIEQARERIVNRLKTLYGGLNSMGGGLSADVTLGSVRSIKVTIVGEVVKPGTYTLSSLTTTFNALYASGGPSENGSYRNIKLYRHNKLVKKIDLYDFLLRADQKDNIRLNDQDVIFISAYDTRIEIDGEVKRPAIYEIEKGESLKNVLDYANGFTEQAYTATINVERNTDTELKLLTIRNADFNTFSLQKGDKYTVGKILDRYENRVSIDGAVFRPGAFALGTDIATVRQLINKAAGLREDAFLNRAFIKRERENLDPEIIAFDLGKVMRGENTDILLKRQDVVMIKTFVELREKYDVSIEGAVNQPKTYLFKDNMTVTDLIILSGGFKDGATPDRIEIARRIKDATGNPSQTIKIIPLKLDKTLQLNEVDKSLILEPFDQIFVRLQSQYQEQSKVNISGEVMYAGNYAIQDKTERISDLIQRAGGLKKEAYIKGAKLIRGKEQVAVDLNQIIENPTNINNLLLIKGDILNIPRLIETVSVEGQVLNPTAVVYNPSYQLKDYLNAVGGNTDSAFVRKIYVKYANGFGDRNRNLWFINRFPKVEPGATIYVPNKPKKHSLISGAERIGVMTAVTSLAYLIINILK